MKLYFLDPTSRPAINISRLKKYSFNIKEKVITQLNTIENLIVLGNGSPEDEVVGVLAFHDMSQKIVGIVKADRHSTDTFSRLKDYRTRLKADNFIFIIDQDNLSLDEIYSHIREIITSQGITIQNEITPSESNRVKIFECKLANQNFRVIAVISGLESFNCSVHEIEDHLLSLAGLHSAINSKD